MAIREPYTSVRESGMRRSHHCRKDYSFNLPRDPSNLGTAYFYLKRYPDAVKAFEQASRMSPMMKLPVGFR